MVRRTLVIGSLLAGLAVAAPAAGASAPARPAQAYSIDQAISDQAQRNTIAFSGLAFLSGNVGADTFLPPGKIADYFGFQYMRDVQPNGMGHNTDFLTRAANNMLLTLSESQRQELIALGRSQESSVRTLAYRRFPVIWAFRRQLSGDIPAGRTSLSRSAVEKRVGDIFSLDGRISYQRAVVYAHILRNLSDAQKARLAPLKFSDYSTWPNVPDPIDKTTMSHETNVLVMTYASDLFSWYLGSLTADTYFCPERHGTYFGGFYMKDAPAMGQADYTIDTALTGDSGAAFLAALTSSQRRQITSIVGDQRSDLRRIVSLRRSISSRLRRLRAGRSVSPSDVLSLSRRYGELDGELSYRYAMAFARVGKTLSTAQRARLVVLRNLSTTPSGAFLYSEPIAMPTVTRVDSLFTRR